MVRTLIEDRERREREIAEEREQMDRLREEERRHYAEESERRIQEVRRQMDHLQGLFTACVTATTGPTRGTNTDTIKLTRLGENDDVEAYLTTFERIMKVNEVPQGTVAIPTSTAADGKGSASLCRTHHGTREGLRCRQDRHPPQI